MLLKGWQATGVAVAAVEAMSVAAAEAMAVAVAAAEAMAEAGRQTASRQAPAVLCGAVAVFSHVAT